MKKLLLFISFIFIFALPCFAYQTVIIHFPNEEIWKAVYYKKGQREAIVQYVPPNQDRVNWKKSVIIHSYKGNTFPAGRFLDQMTAQMEFQNPTAAYRYVKYTPEDSVAIRCTTEYKGIKGQCEIYKLTKGHEGLIAIHYVNRDKNDFKATYNTWYNCLKKAVVYYSHFRDERVMDKAQYYEL